MSGLRERLQRLTGGGPAKRAPAAEASDRPVGIGEPEAVPTGAPSLSDDIGAEWLRLGVRVERNDAGSFLKRTCLYPFAHRHGRYALNELASPAGALGALCAGDEVKLEQLLFLDTETTGLGVGAGNVPFMIGLGFYDGGRFIVEQLFMRHPGEESAMLHYLRERLGRCTHVVSYNGRTFDWPVLKNRFVMNRLPLSGEPIQIDFLYPSRSLWKQTSPSCRLGQVEEDRLRFKRHEDVPGSMAPALYFRYLAENDPTVLEGVFVHNEHDILSLAGLAIHFARLLEGHLALSELPAEEVYRLGIWLDKLGQGELSRQCMEELEQLALADETAYLPAVAEWHKKGGRYESAVRLWHRYVELASSHPGMMLTPYIELAKYYEHKRKNYEQAYRFAEAALERLRQQMTLMRLDVRRHHEYEAIMHRIDRLRAKRTPSPWAMPTLF